MDHLQMFAKNDGTNEDIHAADHSWLVRYFFGKSELSAFRFFSALKCV